MDTYAEAFEAMQADLCQGLLWTGGLYANGPQSTLYICSRTYATEEWVDCTMVNLRTGNIWTKPMRAAWGSPFVTGRTTYYRMRLHNTAYLELMRHNFAAVAVGLDHWLGLAAKAEEAKRADPRKPGAGH